MDRLSPANVAWVERVAGRGARVVARRRLVGGIISSVHSVTVADRGGTRRQFVLKRWVEPYIASPRGVDREGRVLAALSSTPVPAPDLIDVDTDGSAAGDPCVLMTRVPGRVYLTPSDPDSWLSQVAEILPVIHASNIEVPAHKLWFDPRAAAVPKWTRRKALWRNAAELLRSGVPKFQPRFVHTDFQHFNMLWSRGQLSGIVDWGGACLGPPDVDVGHCRLNLAVLFSSEWSERFRRMYESEAGRRLDPFWDVYRIFMYSPKWNDFIPTQVGGRAALDVAGMNNRVQDLLEIAVRRAG